MYCVNNFTKTFLNGFFYNFCMEENIHEKTGEHQVHHSSRRPLTETLRKNPWILSTIILGIFAVLLVAGTGITGNAISEDEAAQIILGFAEEQTGQVLELQSVSENSGLYEVVIIYQGNEVPLYLTKDGKNLVQGLTSLDSLTAPVQQQIAPPVEMTKSDKPTVNLFVMTHCPYGTQAEKGFISTIKALGDQVDAKIRFVHYTMHGEKEDTETLTQVCIREEQSSKWLDYLECFLEDADSARCIDEVNIDEDKLNDCIDNGNADEYYAEDSTLSEASGVSGSPTLVINGAKVSSGRSSDAFLQTICGAFNIAPGDCTSLNLSTESPSPGFGYTASGSDTTAQC